RAIIGIQDWVGVWRCHIVAPEPKEVVLKASRPVAGQGVFDACADGPSPLGEAGAAGRIGRTGRCSVVGRDIDIDVNPGNAALGIDQRASVSAERRADPAGQGAEPVWSHLAGRAKGAADKAWCKAWETANGL